MFENSPSTCVFCISLVLENPTVNNHFNIYNPFVTIQNNFSEGIQCNASLKNRVFEGIIIKDLTLNDIQDDSANSSAMFICCKTLIGVSVLRGDFRKLLKCKHRVSGIPVAESSYTSDQNLPHVTHIHFLFFCSCCIYSTNTTFGPSPAIFVATKPPFFIFYK